MDNQAVSNSRVLVKLKRVSNISFSLIFATYMAIFSFLFFCVFLVLLALGIEKAIGVSPSGMSASMLLLAVLVPVCFWIISFILSIIACFFFNLSLKIFKGLDMYYEETQISQT